MSELYDGEVTTIYVPRAATLPGGDVSAVEFTDHATRIGALEAGHALADHTDASDSAPNDGDAWVYNASTGEWEPQALAPAPAWGDITGTLADQADLSTALAGKASTGHAHTVHSSTRTTTAPSGYLSSGSRSLGSLNVVLASGVEYLVQAELYGQLRGADPGACYYTLSLTVDGNTRTSPGGSDGFWCVQGVPDKYTWEHDRTITGTGAAITISGSVAYHSGGGFNVDRGYLKVSLRPRK